MFVNSAIFYVIENVLLMFLPLLVITLRICCLSFSSLLFNFLLELKYVALFFSIKCHVAVYYWYKIYAYRILTVSAKGICYRSHDR